MDAAEKFIRVSGLICEPARARILWNLLDGRAYTASELAIAADLSPTSASNHLSRLSEADIIRVEVQGRHRYYSFANPEVAYVVEALASLVKNNPPGPQKKDTPMTGVKYCRTCYDHLAGFVGVSIADAMEKKGYLKKSGTAYLVTGKGWIWLEQFEIRQGEFENTRRPLTRQCLDWSERRPHVAGLLGAALLEKMQQRKWFRKVTFSRELLITAKGRQELEQLLGLTL
ncbi:MAG: helix-turn-helix transcriptional regulator [Sphingobacteriales bacterium]|nr:helix-turn-helix transcriptional regulator [Sphingobacteriales bacterium]